MSVLPDDMTMERLAILSQLELGEEETRLAKEDLQKMLTYFDKLSAVDTEGVTPLFHPGMAKGRLRKDEAAQEDQREAILANAPEARDDLFVVPRTI